MLVWFPEKELVGLLMKTDKIQLSAGGGGQESEALIEKIRKFLGYQGKWHGQNEDSAVTKSGQGEFLFFTTDSYTVSPLFFPGGDIGTLAINGTINDLAVRGAKPLAISLGLIIEEGFSESDLKKVLRSIGRISDQEKVPVVTGDTKVMGKGKVDGLVINTSGLGTGTKIIPNSGLRPGNKIVASGTLGDHGATILANRFDYESALRTDCQPLWSQIKSVQKHLTACKDPTRGGLAAIINEMASKAKVKVALDEGAIPFRKETKALCDILGVSPYELASEGRLVAGVAAKQAEAVVKKLQKFDKKAAIIGSVSRGQGVYLKTKIGERKLPVPEGKLVPRIC